VLVCKNLHFSYVCTRVLNICMIEVLLMLNICVLHCHTFYVAVYRIPNVCRFNHGSHMSILEMSAPDSAIQIDTKEGR